MSQPERAAAHTPRANDPEQKWHYLDTHLKDVAKDAEKFAGKFGADKLGYWLGLFHDLDKINPQFQKYLTTEANKKDSVPHAVWNITLLYQILSPKVRDRRGSYA